MVAVQTVTKAEFRSSQTHEFEAMQKIIPAIQAKGYSTVSVTWIYMFSRDIISYNNYLKLLLFHYA